MLSKNKRKKPHLEWLVEILFGMVTMQAPIKLDEIAGGEITSEGVIDKVLKHAPVIDSDGSSNNLI